MAGQAKSQSPSTPLLEWVAAGIGLTLTLAMLGVIGLEALQGTGTALPAVEARVERIVPTAAGFVVEVELRNRSPATAAAVEIEGELSRGEGTVATSSAILDYVPGESSRRAGLFFREDPRRHRLEVRALGYSEP